MLQSVDDHANYVQRNCIDGMLTSSLMFYSLFHEEVMNQLLDKSMKESLINDVITESS